MQIRNLCNRIAQKSPFLRFFAFVLLEVGLLWLLFYPAFMQQAAMQWDATEIYLPWKHFITEQWRHGFLPLWNPYMSGGFPQHGDPGTWYELSYLFAIWDEYNLQSLLYEYLFHLLVAASGIYWLLQSLRFSWLLSVSLGVAYSLNGFFLGNAQHLGWVIGFAWLPWLFLSFWTVLKRAESDKKPWISAMLLGLVSHFQFVGGYLGVTAIALYCLLGSWAIWMWRQQPRYQLFAMKKQFVSLGLAVFCFAGLSLPALLSFWDLQGQITRSVPMSLLDTQFGNWPWQAISSMLFAEPNAEMAQRLGADISLINVRWGLVMLVSLVVAIVRVALRFKLEKTSLLLLLSALGLFSLLIASGPQTPLHGWFIYKLPLLKLFRFPSLYRGLALFLLLVASAYALGSSFSRNRIWGLGLSVLILIDVLCGAHRDIQNTVLVKIPAHEVNATLKFLASKTTSPGMPQSHCLPLRMNVDTAQQWNQRVPFMNQNQGVYLKIWATDGYNPYQIASKNGVGEQAMAYSHGLIGLDDKGRLVKGGVLDIENFSESAQEMVFQGIKVDSAVSSLVVLQNPSKHWALSADDGALSWSDFQGQGIKMAVVDGFRLRYEPKYLGKTIFFLWKLFWLLTAAGLIINGIQYFQKARS